MVVAVWTTFDALRERERQRVRLLAKERPIDRMLLSLLSSSLCLDLPRAHVLDVELDRLV